MSLIQSLFAILCIAVAALPQIVAMTIDAHRNRGNASTSA